MSLDVTLTATRPTEVYTANITHNLNKMAEAAGIYTILWRPEEGGYTHAKDLIEPLRIGIDILRRDVRYFESFNPPNGWGSYSTLVEFATEYLAACEANPDAVVSVSR